MGKTTRNSAGFTLIELMIVIAIIIIIIAVTMPNLLRSRMAANEGSAIANMRTITSAEQQFQSAVVIQDAAGVGRYGTLPELIVPDPPYIDTPLATGQRTGYDYVVVLGGSPGYPRYTATANPVTMDRTGSKGFFVDDSGVITWVSGGVAGPDDLPVH
jgi:type IV pilus assembly protein PilA